MLTIHELRTFGTLQAAIYDRAGLILDVWYDRSDSWPDHCELNRDGDRIDIEDTRGCGDGSSYTTELSVPLELFTCADDTLLDKTRAWVREEIDRREAARKAEREAAARKADDDVLRHAEYIKAKRGGA